MGLRPLPGFDEHRPAGLQGQVAIGLQVGRACGDAATGLQVDLAGRRHGAADLAAFGQAEVVLLVPTGFIPGLGGQGAQGDLAQGLQGHVAFGTNGRALRGEVATGHRHQRAPRVGDVKGGHAVQCGAAGR